MTLRTKTLATLTFVSLMAAAALYFAALHIVRTEFKALEEREVSEHVKRVQLAFENYVSLLTSKTTDWAQWDDTYAFMSDHNEEYLTSNISFETLSAIFVTHVVYIDAHGKLVRGFTVDYKDQTVSEIQQDKAEELTVPGILAGPGPSDIHSGVTTISNQLYTFAAVPIFDSRRNGRSRGTLVFTVALDQKFIDGLAEQTRLRVKVHDLNDWNRIANNNHLATPQMSEVTFHEAGRDFISGFASLQDITGNNVRMIEVILERTIVQNGEQATTILGLALITVMVVALIASMLTLHLTVLRPVFRFQQDVRKINYRKLKGDRIRVTGNDELAQLGTDINILLSALEQTHHDLEKAKNSAERANESKSLFFSTLSHDIKNTVGAIKGWLESGLRKNSGPDFRRCMANAYQATSGLISVVSGLLDFHKAESGNLTFEKIPFSLQSVLQEVRLTVSSLLKGSRVSFGIRISPLVPDQIVGDPTKLQRVLTNLLSNAAKFTKHGEINLEIDSEGSNSKKQFTFEVWDTGVGISKEQTAHLFKPFQQAELSTERNYKGTGLGLYICKSIVEGLGGTLIVKSNVGEGTSFKFSIDMNIQEDSQPVYKEIVGALAIVSRYGKESPLYRSLGELTKEIEAFNSLEELNSPSKFKHIILVSEAGESLGNLKVIESHLDKVLLCVDMRNDQELREKSEQGFRAVLGGPVLTTEILNSLDENQRTNFQFSISPPKLAQAKSAFRILYVDDAEINRIAPGELLKEAGYQVSFAGDGDEMLAIIESQLNGNGEKFDLIITDVSMPRMDGTIAAQNIRALEKRLGKKASLPIVAVTGYSSDHERTQIMSYGINDVIDKPVNPQELSNAITKLLGGSPSSK